MPVKLLAATALVLAMGVAAADAQSRLAGHAPAELPPAGFTGNQYVDSRGCAFIRAGFDGRVTWVPRLGDNRRPMCGLPPSVGGRTAAAPAASTPRPARSTPRAAPPPVAAAPAARPEGAHPSCPDNAPFGQPIVREDGSRAIRCTATPAQVAAAAPRPVQTAAAAARPAGAHPSCPDAAPFGQPFERADGSRAIRCTAAPAPVAAPVRPAAPVAVASAADAAACLPLRPRSQQGVGHVATRPGAVPVCPPAATSARPDASGYVPVWQDDRLNPYRAVGTSQGDAAMNRVWSQTVPRQELARPAAAAAPVRSGPAPASVSGHFVQVGSFSVPANASAVVARLEARGLPVQISRVRQSGRVHEVVLAGPFASQEALAQALATVRGLGYRDAFTRPAVR